MNIIVTPFDTGRYREVVAWSMKHLLSTFFYEDKITLNSWQDAWKLFEYLHANDLDFHVKVEHTNGP